MTTATRRHQRAVTLDVNDPDLTTPGAWMGMAEVCALLHESRSTVDKWRARGLFPRARRKPNGSLLFRRDDIASFIASLEVAA